MAVFKSELNAFFYSIKSFFIDIYEGIRDFLLKYMDKTTLGIFTIAIVAIILILIFKRINHN